MFYACLGNGLDFCVSIYNHMQWCNILIVPIKHMYVKLSCHLSWIQIKLWWEFFCMLIQENWNTAIDKNLNVQFCDIYQVNNWSLNGIEIIMKSFITQIIFIYHVLGICFNVQKFKMIFIDRMTYCVFHVYTWNI